MNVLIIGQGGREHALVMGLKASPQVKKIFVLPGNDGMAVVAERVNILSSDQARVVEFCKTQKINLVVIGPEAELVAGLADILRDAGVRVFGPSAAGAQLEGSKIFAKDFMIENKIPTGRAVVVESVADVEKSAAAFKPPYVLKADGLAAGKGVFICDTLMELLGAAQFLFDKKGLGPAGSRALLEEFLPGRELSWLVVTNGTEYQSLPLCRDHKKLLDGDKGPNTGGMGVVGPLEIDSELRAQIEREVVAPSIAGIKKRGFNFRGVVYVGIILSSSGPRVLEYNTRFGDPECQVIVPLLDGDWYSVLAGVADGHAPQMKWKNESVACLVLAAEGYPENPVKGVAIEGQPTYIGREGYLLHAGTKLVGDKFVTNGGRVLNAVGTGRDLPEALKNAYVVAEHARWPGRQLRKDIGK
jgi:phosphoribosylamine---glycine ligase